MTNEIKINTLGATEILNANKKFAFKSSMQPTYEILNDYSSLIDQSTGLTGFTKGNLEKVLLTIKKITNENSQQVSKLAKHLQADTLLQTAFNVWHFCVNNIVYKLDADGTEELRSPARTYSDKIADCDDFTIFCSAVFKELGYNPKAHVVAFYNDENFGHIYCVVNDIVCDPVMTYAFNEHPKGITKTKIVDMNKNIQGLGFDININSLFGIPENTDYIIGLGGFTAPISNITRELMDKQTEIMEIALNGLQDVSEIEERLQPYMGELRKCRQAILMNGMPEQIDLLKIMPEISDIKNNEIIFKDSETQTAYKSELGKITLFTSPLSSKFIESLLSTKKVAKEFITELVQKRPTFLNSEIKKAMKKVEKAYEKLGGNPSHVKTETLRGKDKMAILATTDAINGLGEPATVAATTAVAGGGGFLASILEFFKGIDFKKVDEITKTAGEISIIAKDIAPILKPKKPTEEGFKNEVERDIFNNANKRIDSDNDEKDNTLLYGGLAVAGIITAIIISKQN